MKLKLLGILLSGLLVGGCATPEIVTRVQTVQVPVTVFCKVDLPAKPSFPFDDTARQSMSLFEKTKLLVAQDRIQKGYIKALEGALAGCKAPDYKDHFITTQ